MPAKTWTRALACALLLAGTGTGCASVVDEAVYGAWEQFGVEKRHILADRIEAGREDQRDAQEQFQTTLEAFQALTGFEGGDLERVYRKLEGEFEDSEEAAQDVRDRIASIEDVANDLFEEWEQESVQISDPGMRARSASRLRDTQADYRRLIGAMQRAAGRMDPVLTSFRDRVLYLKHGLNASAIASLEKDLGEIQGDVAVLIEDMNRSIAEADQFLAGFDER